MAESTQCQQQKLSSLCADLSATVSRCQGICAAHRAPHARVCLEPTTRLHGGSIRCLPTALGGTPRCTNHGVLMSQMGPAGVKTCASRECAELFSPFPVSTATASAVLFLFNVIETNFLRASSTLEFSHRLGQVRKCPCLHGTSVAPSRADVARPPQQVRFVPTTDSCTAANTSSAWASSLDPSRFCAGATPARWACQRLDDNE
jgi:hypothetical protein